MTNDWTCIICNTTMRRKGSGLHVSKLHSNAWQAGIKAYPRQPAYMWPKHFFQKFRAQLIDQVISANTQKVIEVSPSIEFHEESNNLIVSKREKELEIIIEAYKALVMQLMERKVNDSNR